MCFALSGAIANSNRLMTQIVLFSTLFRVISPVIRLELYPIVIFLPEIAAIRAR